MFGLACTRLIKRSPRRYELPNLKVLNKVYSDLLFVLNNVHYVPTEKYSVARSPTENDRTGLLREAEPIDYTEDRGDSLMDYTRSSTARSTGYQSGGSSRFGSNRQASNKPPRGIFDDV